MAVNRASFIVMGVCLALTPVGLANAKALGLQDRILARLGVVSSAQVPPSSNFTDAEKSLLKVMFGRETFAAAISEVESVSPEVSFNATKDLCIASMGKVIAIPTLFNLRENKKTVVDSERMRVLHKAIYESHNASACQSFRWTNEATGESCSANELMERFKLRIAVGRPYGSCTSTCQNVMGRSSPPAGIETTSQYGSASGFLSFWRKFARNELATEDLSRDSVVALHRDMRTVFSNQAKTTGYGLPVAFAKSKILPKAFYRKGGSLALFSGNMMCVGDGGYFQLPSGKTYAAVVILNQRLNEAILGSPNISESIKKKVRQGKDLGSERNSVGNTILRENRDRLTRIYQEILNELSGPPLSISRPDAGLLKSRNRR